MNEGKEFRLKFNIRPSPVLAEHRPLYKIGQLILILWIASRAGKSSYPRLHLFNWALKNGLRVNRLIDAAKNRSLKVVAWGFDPALALAIKFAEAEGLVTTAGKGVELTDLGETVAKDIMLEIEVLSQDKDALSSIGKGITESMVEEAAKEWQP